MMKLNFFGDKTVCGNYWPQELVMDLKPASPSRHCFSVHLNYLSLFILVIIPYFLFFL